MEPPRISRAGSDRSVTLTIRATGVAQLEAIHRTLMAYAPVRLVL
jgi:putative lipoic acid-binding regulatory protein